MKKILSKVLGLKILCFVDSEVSKNYYFEEITKYIFWIIPYSKKVETKKYVK